MESWVVIVLTVVGGITLVCIAPVAWLALLTLRGLASHERLKRQEFDAKMLGLDNRYGDIKGEILKLRADVEEIKQLLSGQTSAGNSAHAGPQAEARRTMEPIQTQNR